MSTVVLTQIGVRRTTLVLVVKVVLVAGPTMQRRMLLRSVLFWVDAHDCEPKLFLSSPNVRKGIETVLLWWLFQVVVKTWADLSRC